MGHVCRVCEKSFKKVRQEPSYASVLVCVEQLETECVDLELDLRDSFNAFCFKCKHISMSVPRGLSAIEQICYLRSQVDCFQQMKNFNLVSDED